MNQVQNLQHIARELLYLGMDGSPIYTDHFRQLNTEVFRLSEALFSMKGATSEEEAAICLSLLMLPFTMMATKNLRYKAF